MSLSSNVQGRYQTRRLVALTNPEDRTGTTIDTTRLAYACTDAEAEFQRRTATEYDDTVPAHVDVCVELVVLKLMERGGGSIEATERQRQRVEQQFDSLARVTGRDRPEPTSSGGLVDFEREGADGATVLNRFDPRNLRGWRPRSPSGS